MKINIVKGDIFSVLCDAYVNPTDVKLSGSGGLDKIFHIKGGADLKKQCASLRGKIEQGAVGVTSGGDLSVKYILHAVSPRCAEETGDKYDHLKSCYMNILKAASDKSDIRHLALPLVGTGAAGYSLTEPYYADSIYSLTAVTILASIAGFPVEYRFSRILDQVTIVCVTEEQYTIMNKVYRWIFGKGISKRERIRGSLLGGAIGDALGYPVEFSGAEESFIKDYILDTETGSALISDDTQMTLFTACGLLWGYSRSCMRGIGGDPWNYIAIAYKDWLKTQEPDFKQDTPPVSWVRNIPALNKRRAPGNTCLSALRNGGGSVESPINNSKGCGGVMRIAPIPLYCAANRHFDQTYIAKVCAETAAITHGHPLGWLSAAALGNILFDIMQNFSLAYSVLETISFLKENYSEYPETERMIFLITRAEQLAALDGYTSSTNLIAEFDITKQLGEGWVGEEALAIGLFCVLAASARGVEQCMQNAVGHIGDSDSTGSIAGQIWGAYYGESSFPGKWLQKLELSGTIREIADDLTNDCKMSEYSSYHDAAWARKYLAMENSTHIPGEFEEEPHFFVQTPFQECSMPYFSYETENVLDKTTMKSKLILKDGKFLRLSQEEPYKKLPGFNHLKTEYDIDLKAYVKEQGWVRYIEDGTAEGYYNGVKFTLLTNQVKRCVEVFCDIGPNPWVGTIRRRTDEWDNPIEIEFKDASPGISWEMLALTVMDKNSTIKL